MQTAFIRKLLLYACVVGTGLLFSVVFFTPKKKTDNKLKVIATIVNNKLNRT